MTINVYQKGDLARISGVFTNTLGTAIDPTGLTLKYTPPSGTTVSLVYDTDPEVVRDSLGNYHVDLDVNEAGRWFYRWEATGTGQAVEHGEFMVEGKA